MKRPEVLQQDWTSGAERVLVRASLLAHWQSASAILPVHLLWALLREESRASARLIAAGVSPEVFATAFAVTLLPDASAQDQTAEFAATVWQQQAIRQLPWDRETLALLAEAEIVARQQVPPGEVRTDHLLESLTRIESPVSRLLATHGIAPSVAAPLPKVTLELPTAVPQEFQLEWKTAAPSSTTELYRLLDASANRLREGLRVIEDHVRFGRNDSFLARELKETRHQLQSALAPLSGLALLAARDTLGDVGTAITTATETVRVDLRSVLTAAFKRAEEAARSLEEFGKLIDPTIGQQMEQLRYRLYTLEKAVLRADVNQQRLNGLSVYLLLTEAACPTGAGRVLHEALAGGVRLVQVREKSLTDRQLVALCREWRTWTRRFEALLIINDRPDIAAIVDADGVHVGQDELTVSEARQIVGPDRLVGVSTHSIEQARQAVLDGADYLGVGPTFPSGTKSFESFPGLELVSAVAAEITLPWYAIGGIEASNVETVRAAGATRVAVSQAICRAVDPRRAAQQLIAALPRAALAGGGAGSGTERDAPTNGI